MTVRKEEHCKNSHFIQCVSLMYCVLLIMFFSCFSLHVCCIHTGCGLCTISLSSSTRVICSWTASESASPNKARSTHEK